MSASKTITGSNFLTLFALSHALIINAGLGALYCYCSTFENRKKKNFYLSFCGHITCKRHYSMVVGKTMASLNLDNDTEDAG